MKDITRRIEAAGWSLSKLYLRLDKIETALTAPQSSGVSSWRDDYKEIYYFLEDIEHETKEAAHE